MFFTLLKEIPQMFVIAAIIWGFVLWLFIKKAGKKEVPFFTRHRTGLLATAVALALTVGDIWLFIEYIPTHFKKHPVEEVSLSAKDLLIDSSLNDTIHKAVMAPEKKESLQQNKANAIDVATKTYLTNKASIRFFSHGDAEDIEATNHAAVCSLNNKTGEIRFTALIKNFVFENEMMQDHFNDEKYMNSAVFPKTTFAGSIQKPEAIDFTKDGNYAVTANGALTIHGIRKNITAKGQVIIVGSNVSLKSVFTIKRMDFGITTDEIADELEITVLASFK